VTHCIAPLTDPGEASLIFGPGASLYAQVELWVA
jgi:hypothetical protein